MSDPPKSLYDVTIRDPEPGHAAIAGRPSGTFRVRSEHLLDFFRVLIDNGLDFDVLRAPILDSVIAAEARGRSSA